MARISAHVSVAKPFTRAPRLFPVTDLHLSIGAKAVGSRVNRRYLAIRIHAYTITVQGNTIIIIHGASTVVVIVRLEAKRLRDINTVVIA